MSMSKKLNYQLYFDVYSLVADKVLPATFLKIYRDSHVLPQNMVEN